MTGAKAQPERETSGHDVALYGITGALGREVLSALEVEHEGIARFFPIAGTHSAGGQTRWRGASPTVLSPAEVDPSSVDFAILAIPSDAVAREAGRLLEAGARLIDASGTLGSPPVPRALSHPAPLAWPGMSNFNSIDLEDETALALPSAAVSTLAPLIDAILVAHAGGALPRLTGVDATVLLAASSAGRTGVEALSRHAVGLLNYRPILDPRPFPTALAFNVIGPSTDDTVLFEARATSELRRLCSALGDARIELQPIWIPSFSGICASVSLRFDAPVDPGVFQRVLAAHPELAFGMPIEVPADDIDDTDDLEPDEAPAEVEPPMPEDVLSLRGVLERHDVRVSTPLFGPDGSVRVVLMADPIERTAQAAATILMKWMAVLDAD